MMRMNFREHRFGGQEHHGAITGLAGNDVLARNIVDMFAHVCLERSRRRTISAIGQHAFVVFQRKLRIHRDQPRGLGQLQHAVGTHPVGKGVLEFIGAGRQHILDDRFQLYLAKRAA